MTIQKGLKNDARRRRIAALFSVIFVAAVLLRFSSFAYSVQDWDESLYLLIAKAMKAGHLPYTVIWDHKPPGIYVLFYLALSFFGSSIWAIRIAACLTVAAGATLILLITELFAKNPATPWFAAGLYLLSTGVNGGLASNTEIFFIPLCAGAFYILLNQRKNGRDLSAGSWFKIGLLFGLAIQIKQVIIGEAAVAWLTATGRRISARTAGFWGWMALGLSLPTLACFAWFYFSGHWTEYFFANFTANLNREGRVAASPSLIRAYLLQMIRANPLLLFGFLVPVAPWALRKIPEGKILSLWFLGSLAGALLGRRFFPHYFLEVLPPLAVFVALGLDAYGVFDFRNWRFRKIPAWGLITAYVLFMLIPAIRMNFNTFYHQSVLHEEAWADVPSEVAGYLTSRVMPEDYVFVADYQPIVYFLLPSRIPTRFVFPSHMGKLAGVAGIDPSREIQSILDKRPKYIIVTARRNQPMYPYAALSRGLDQNYVLEKQIRFVEIYRLKDKI